MKSQLPFNRLSRRQFLRQTATTVGAAMAFPSIVPASALGRNGTVPPSERITMGFIGVGAQGGGHLFGGGWTYVVGGFAGREDVQVLAVCDIRRPRVEQAGPPDSVRRQRERAPLRHRRTQLGPAPLRHHPVGSGRGRHRSVEIFVEDGRSGYRYASGVVVYGRRYHSGTVFTRALVRCVGMTPSEYRARH